MVRHGWKITAIVAGILLAYPALAEVKASSDVSIAKQDQPMDAAAPDGSYQEPTDGDDDKRAEMTADFKPVAEAQPQAPVASVSSPAPQQQHHGDNQLTGNSEKPEPGQVLAQQEPAANAVPQQQHQGDNQLSGAPQQAPAPAPGQALAMAEPQPNQEAPHRDFQPSHKEEEDLHGMELSEADESVYENDQQQYEQAQAGMNSSLDRRNNELNDRINQEQAKLRSDNEANNSVEIEDDKQRLTMDKHELAQQEAIEANHTQNLPEFNDQDHSDMPMVADNADATANTPASPPADTPAQGPELAMNSQPARTPW
jgi:hypothetical protein